jgi:hypothetical protein
MGFTEKRGRMHRGTQRKKNSVNLCEPLCNSV